MSALVRGPYEETVDLIDTERASKSYKAINAIIR